SRVLGLCPGTVRAYLERCGGIRPHPRSRGRGRLSLAEREEISRGLAEGCSLRQIARRLHRAPSTIGREVTAGGGRRRYRALKADDRAWARAARPKPWKLVSHPQLCRLVADKLLRRWSPQQIAGWLKATFPDDEDMQVSHESIYRTLFVQPRGALRRELTIYLRTGRALRRPKGVRLPDGRGARPGTLHISARPAEASDRAVPGHWEGDLVFGKGMSPVATLVERSTRFLMLVALPRGDHRADAVADALAAAITRLPSHLARSLTWDLGHEMAQHARFSAQTGVQVYFCDPKSPWQRGSNENT
ncbi:IS30 family transposase, partial [Kineococcus esterisolvens]|uniref:IS30 family transposase n=2 Tax=Kineococcus TaxID=33981 RepID=UPI003D7E8896